MYFLFAPDESVFHFTSGSQTTAAFTPNNPGVRLCLALSRLSVDPASLVQRPGDVCVCAEVCLLIPGFSLLHRRQGVSVSRHSPQRRERLARKHFLVL